MQNAFKSPQTLRLFPEKLFYKIGEASRIVEVESYVLRYWETEFPFLSPRKSKSGQRIYTKKDIDLLLQIKKLLYEERYTIDGVRRKLGGNISGQEAETVPEEKPIPKADTEKVISMVKEKLGDLLKILS
ncbi:MAG: MerR family transcriptional regulator [Thermodesulfovibrio sp.]|nr:MerR family transcriptional regulator [Thermodesulfovibrio sp.]